MLPYNHLSVNAVITKNIVNNATNEKQPDTYLMATDIKLFVFLVKVIFAEKEILPAAGH